MRLLFRNNKKLLLGIVLTGIMVILAIVGFFYTPYDPNAMNASQKFAKASFEHILGCDNFGRDIFSRIIAGLSTTMIVAVGTVVIGTVIGTIIGALTGYFGGVFDEVLMRFNDAVLAFPSILLALVFLTVMGTGKYNVMIALGVVFVPSYARIVRSEFIQCKNHDYVKSAKLKGASDLRIIFIHILPNAFSVMMSSVAIGFNNAVLAEAGMSYLGIGVQPPASSLGSMLSDAQAFCLKSQCMR